MVMIVILLVMVKDGVVLLGESLIRKVWFGTFYHHYANISIMATAKYNMLMCLHIFTYFLAMVVNTPELKHFLLVVN